MLIPPNSDSGELTPNEQKMLSTRAVPQTMEIGYLTQSEANGRRSVLEIVAMPIRSSETDEVVGALVLGFEPVDTTNRETDTGMQNGILTSGELLLPRFDQAAEEQIARAVTRA